MAGCTGQCTWIWYESSGSWEPGYSNTCESGCICGPAPEQEGPYDLYVATVACGGTPTSATTISNTTRATSTTAPTTSSTTSSTSTEPPTTTSSTTSSSSTTAPTTSSTTSTTTTTTTPCAGSCIYSWSYESSGWVLVDNACEGEDCVCGDAPPLSEFEKGDTYYTFCRVNTPTSTSTTTSTTSTTTTPAVCVSSCLYLWDSSGWRLLTSDCSAGCYCPGPPAYSGTILGQPAILSCSNTPPTTTTTTTTTAGPCTGFCTWVWTIANTWSQGYTTCAGPCGCPERPTNPGAFAGQEVRVACVPTTTTSTTTTGAPGVTTTSTTATTTTTAPCAGYSIWDYGQSPNRVVVQSFCPAGCHAASLAMNTYGVIIYNTEIYDADNGEYSIYSSADYLQRCYLYCESDFISSSTTTTTTTRGPKVCRDSCSWQWNATSEKWLKYGLDRCDYGKYDLIQTDPYPYYQFVDQNGCFCGYPDHDGTYDGQITTAPCIITTACSDCRKRAIPLWCEQGLTYLPRTLTITFSDPENVMPCIDGFSVVLNRRKEDTRHVDYGNAVNGLVDYTVDTTSVRIPSCDGTVSYIPGMFDSYFRIRCPKHKHGLVYGSSTTTNADIDPDLYLIPFLTLWLGTPYSGLGTGADYYDHATSCMCKGRNSGKLYQNLRDLTLFRKPTYNLNMMLSGMLGRGQFCCEPQGLKYAGGASGTIENSNAGLACWPYPGRYGSTFGSYYGGYGYDATLPVCPIDSCNPFIISGSFSVTPNFENPNDERLGDYTLGYYLDSGFRWKYGATGTGKVYWTVTE